MSSSYLLQQSPACLVRLIWMVFEMGGRWPYSCCFVGCFFEDLFNIACIILEQLPSNFSLYTWSAPMWCIHIVVWTEPLLGKKLRFISSDRFDSHMTDNLWIADGGSLKLVDGFTYFGRSVSSTENDINIYIYIYIERERERAFLLKDVLNIPNITKKKKQNFPL